MWKFAILFILAFLGIGFVDVQERNAELQRFLRNKHDALELIAARYGIGRGQCSEYDHSHADTYHLAAALITVETLATPRLEMWARYGMVKLAALVGIRTPNISIGPGRIRLSTARSALARVNTPRLQYYRSLSEDQLANELLTTCPALQIAVAIVEDVHLIAPASARSLDLKSVRETARIYNGEGSQLSSLDAMVSAEIYFELVYGLFEYYRFMALEQGSTRPITEAGS